MEPEVEPSNIELSEIEFDHEELRVFWELARFHAKLNAAPTYFGPTTLESVPPPAWAYGESAEESDAFVAQVLADERETSAAAGDYAGELPEVGVLSILCDGWPTARAGRGQRRERHRRRPDRVFKVVYQA